MSLDICGPFSKGIKCKVQKHITVFKTIKTIFIHQLNAINTLGLGVSTVALLFFTTSISKFCLVQQDNKMADSLELKQTYFVKNCTQKKVDDVFVASGNTVIRISKKKLDDAQRCFRQIIVRYAV